MAKITREQVEKINSGCNNGFGLDLRHFLFHNEKTLSKKIRIADNQYIEARILFYDKWNRETRKTDNIPTIHLSRWTVDTNGTGTSYGLGYWVRLQEALPRKNMKVLQEITNQFDDSAVLELYNKESNTKVNLMA